MGLSEMPAINPFSITGAISPVLKKEKGYAWLQPNEKDYGLIMMAEHIIVNPDIS